MSKLLIHEPPLQVLPSLAEKIGLNEAIVLQQLHYWIENKKSKGREHNGFKWVFNTYADWQQDNFPFWSIATIQRIFASLEEQKIIVSEQIDKQKHDMTKFYRIAYDELDKLEHTNLVSSKTPHRDDVNKNTETTAKNTRNNSKETAAAVSQFNMNASKTKANTILCNVTTFAHLSDGLREKEETVYQLLQTYPEKDVITALQDARSEWVKCRRKDNNKQYSVLNPAWVDWAVAHLAGETPWEAVDDATKKEKSLMSATGKSLKEVREELG